MEDPSIQLSSSSQESPQIIVVEKEVGPPASFCSRFCCSCCSNCCEPDEVRPARKELSNMITDWLMDAGMAAYHILFRGDLVAGILTYAIVLNAGIIITFTNFCPNKGYKNEMRLVKAEIWRMSKFYGVLMYIPSFFPICSAYLRLQYAKKLKSSKKSRPSNPQELEDLRNKMKIFKEKALWDGCCEAFLEAFPQSVLQIVLLLLPGKTYSNLFEYLPIGTVLWNLYGITGAPLEVLSARDPTFRWNIFQKLAAYASNVLRVFSSSLFIVAVLTFASHDASSSAWITSAWIVFASTIIFGLMAGLYVVKYEIDRCLLRRQRGQEESSTIWRKCPETVLTLFGLITSILAFYFWVAAQILPTGTINIRTGIAVGLFSGLVGATCIGLLLFRHKLSLYHEVTGDIPISAYKGAKGWLGKLFLCKKT